MHAEIKNVTVTCIYVIIWARKKGREREKKRKEKNDLIVFFVLPTIHSILEHILYFTKKK